MPGYNWPSSTTKILTLHKKKFPIKDFFGKCDLDTSTEDILNGKLHFFCSVISIPYNLNVYLRVKNQKDSSFSSGDIAC